MRNVKTYVIQWEPAEPGNNGQALTSFTSLPGSYLTETGAFLGNVAAASGSFGNPYSVDMLYGEPQGGEYHSEFGGSFVDGDSYPARDLSTCPVATPADEGLPPENEPCISDSKGPSEEKNFQLAEEVLKFLNAHPSLPTGLNAIYFVVTPNHVNSCSGFEGGVAACNTNYYCAYHSAFEFERNGSRHIAVYANMPYADRPGCATPDQPNKSEADDEIDVLGHEDNEAITDPLGNAWFDVGGNEVADKCTYPFFDPLIDFEPAANAYGPMLGGEVAKSYNGFGEAEPPGDAYNEEINGGHYLLQREWSNATGGCVARAPIPAASFSAYSSPALVSQSISFNGSASSPSAGALQSYSWNFGDGGPEVLGAQVSHSYPTAGTYTVTLTVTNDSGASASTSQSIVVQPPSPPAPTPEPITLTKTVNVLVAVEPVAYTAAQIAQKLGLPGNGARLQGLGTIALGHAECPPACTVALRLYATRSVKVHGRHFTKRVFIGALTTRLANKGTGALALRLNAEGRKLLSRNGRLASLLTLTVTGREGGSWQIVRKLTLTRSGRTARAVRTARHRQRR